MTAVGGARAVPDGNRHRGARVALVLARRADLTGGGTRTSPALLSLVATASCIKCLPMAVGRESCPTPSDAALPCYYRRVNAQHAVGRTTAKFRLSTGHAFRRNQRDVYVVLERKRATDFQVATSRVTVVYVWGGGKWREESGFGSSNC